MIFRNDDVNSNTNKMKLAAVYGVIHSIFPDAEIWSCITLFSGKNNQQAVYGDLPLKTKDTKWFYNNADSFMYDYRHPLYKVASHGLYHVDHSKISRETQEMSILGSCSYLKTTKFVPPFNKFNQDTIDICFDNGITMCAGSPWKSIEYEKFDPLHKHWYMHSWRWEPKQLREVLENVYSDKNS